MEIGVTTHGRSCHGSMPWEGRNPLEYGAAILVEAMSDINERPVILALSNPTEHAECTPEQAYSWSKGKAIYAAGVQFPPVDLDGQTFLPGQANNFYIFPAIGMAVFATQAARVTDEMFIELKKHWNEEQIVEIVGVIAMFGFLNRWNDTLATPLEDEPIEVGDKFLAGHGWSVGKHGPTE